MNSSRHEIKPMGSLTQNEDIPRSQPQRPTTFLSTHHDWHAMANLQMQWDLTRTGDSTVSFARGFIRASTSDNVQPLALLACEKFGATLAICPDTRRNVEYHILKAQSRPATIVSFLGATIGYSTDDCGTYLAQSLAGIQFLALAATLVPGLIVFEGGQVLAKMLEASASDKHSCHPLGIWKIF